MLGKDDTKVIMGRMTLEEEMCCLFPFRLSYPTWDSTGLICAALMNEHWKESEKDKKEVHLLK